MHTPETSHNQWTHEFNNVVRGASGGFLFSIPLLYTMEVWWAGTYINAQRMCIALVFAFGAVFLLNRAGGFRQGQRTNLLDTIIASTQALAIALVFTAAVLVLLRRITLETPLDEALGKIIYESVSFSLGIALANQLISSGRDKQQSGQQQHAKGQLKATLQDVGATMIGATFIGLTIAPTTEVPLLGSALSAPWLLALMAASLLISYGIVFQSGFSDARKRQQQQGIFQQPVSETVASYLVSLALAALMLWFFKQLSLDDPWYMWLNYSIVLGLPAAVGGAAGRLAV
jgi:putative integral membrane protein (TIGR02587 family)